MSSHEIDYALIGDDMQLVEVSLDPREAVIAEAGMLAYVEQDITFVSKMGDGSEPNQGFFGALFSAGKRMLTGESLFLTHFTNNAAEGQRKVAFAAPYPGKIIPLDLGETDG
ncbi:MAG: AIM24 family protein, partial [Myxococcota bacterium]